MERLRLFLRKITTIVAAVAVFVFAHLQFPGLNDERMEYFEAEKDGLADDFFAA
jgi:ferrous iron transport protein B